MGWEMVTKNDAMLICYVNDFFYYSSFMYLGSYGLFCLYSQMMRPAIYLIVLLNMKRNNCKMCDKGFEIKY